MNQISLHSPIGDLTVFEDAGAIISLDWGWVPEQDTSPTLKEAQRQLNDYFDGRLSAFNLQLNPYGTEFQKQVWRGLEKIPKGSTLSYGQLAKNINSHPRAVGGACGKNPIPIIIPCHRVLASNGAIGGYSGDGGVETKAQLLTLEGALKP